MPITKFWLKGKLVLPEPGVPAFLNSVMLQNFTAYLVVIQIVVAG